MRRRSIPSIRRVQLPRARAVSKPIPDSPPPVREDELPCPRVQQRIAALPERAGQPLACPELTDSPGPLVFLGIRSFERHMTNEGWELQQGLASAGYRLVGRNLDDDDVNVPRIVARLRPGTVIIQDKREWDPDNPACYDKQEAFESVEVLAQHPEIFKVTICKDAHAAPDYNREFCQQAGVHAWIVYYHQAMVSALARHVRPEHLVRTYHSVDPAHIPEFQKARSQRCLLSGAMSREVYPLRHRFYQFSSGLGFVDTLRHPGYGLIGARTASFLSTLSRYRVAICTASIYGYALRKIIEATACGCRVITDLPPDEILPVVEPNLIRIHPHMPVPEISQVIQQAADEWDPDRQKPLAERTTAYYDFRQVGQRLARDLAAVRRSILLSKG